MRFDSPLKQPQAAFYDYWILFPALILIIFGLLMVASASMVISDRMYGNPLHYLMKQSTYVGIGLILGWITMQVPIRVWQKLSINFLLITLFLLFVVLVPGIGKVVNGSRRWLGFGFISLQVSEIIKITALVYLASYLQRYKTEVENDIIGFIKPLILLAIIVVLLLLEPDFGSAAVLSVTFFALLFIGGARLWPFTLLLLLAILAMCLLAVASPYRVQRLTTFLDPWKTAYGTGYQLTQSLIAFGRGGIFGVGLGNSIQKLFYLPEAHTDFIFAVIAEELGLIGELFLILMYFLLVMRIFAVGRMAQAKDKLFSAYLAFGFGIWLSLQTMINMGVNAGLLPTKGLTLPFISSGGSSLLINCMVIGILLRLSFEIRSKSTIYSIDN